MGQHNERDYTWDDLVSVIGDDFSGGEIVTADEVIAYTDVVRYCEPWEIGNAIYWDEDLAKKAGYRGVVVPWSSIKQTFSYSGRWRPGEPTRFNSSGAESTSRLGTYQPGGNFPPIPMPKTSQAVVTHMEIAYFEPVVVGDQLHSKGRKLTEVRPRQTKIGFGAFTTMVTEIYNQLDQLVARVHEGLFQYNTDS